MMNLVQIDDPLVDGVMLTLNAEADAKGPQPSSAYVLRALAFAVDHDAFSMEVLAVLGESREQALASLSASCWEEDLRDDESLQRSALRESLAALVPEHLRPAGWPGGTQ
ncbi:hypothetical protein [Pseudomonas sp. LRF_L74]|uniref:hypothetical protein n=1 Tax=Pseudomonas sp. LRF_L74 TaxID=3369422 RepID=UPI003F5DDF08